MEVLNVMRNIQRGFLKKLSRADSSNWHLKPLSTSYDVTFLQLVQPLKTNESQIAQGLYLLSKIHLRWLPCIPLIVIVEANTLASNMHTVCL